MQEMAPTPWQPVSASASLSNGRGDKSSRDIETKSALHCNMRR